MTNFSEILLNTLLDSVKSTAELAEMMMCSRTESYRRFRNDLRGCVCPEKRIRKKIIYTQRGKISLICSTTLSGRVL